MYRGNLYPAWSGGVLEGIPDVSTSLLTWDHIDAYI